MFCEGLLRLLPEARLAAETELAVEAIEEALFCEDKLRDQENLVFSYVAKATLDWRETKGWKVVATTAHAGRTVGMWLPLFLVSDWGVGRVACVLGTPDNGMESNTKEKGRAAGGKGREEKRRISWVRELR